jgi:hypothetical protein
MSKFSSTQLQVVDTPGLFDTSGCSNFEIQVELTRALALTLCEIHAFVFVLNVSRVTQEEFDAFCIFIGKFGTSHSIVALTHGENLEEEGITVEQLLTSANKKFG